jgi:hypothetical protein
MAKLKFLFICLMTFGALAAFAQGSERKLSKIEAGTVLTTDDIGFLTLVANPKIQIAQSESSSEVTLSGKKYTAGQKLTKEDSESLNAAITDFRKSNPGLASISNDKSAAPKKARAFKNKAICWYWYQWCDAWGTCYWYKRWYYC